MSALLRPPMTTSGCWPPRSLLARQPRQRRYPIATAHQQGSPPERLEGRPKGPRNQTVSPTFSACIAAEKRPTAATVSVERDVVGQREGFLVEAGQPGHDELAGLRVGHLPLEDEGLDPVIFVDDLPHAQRLRGAGKAPHGPGDGAAMDCCIIDLDVSTVSVGQGQAANLVQRDDAARREPLLPSRRRSPSARSPRDSRPRFPRRPRSRPP